MTTTCVGVVLVATHLGEFWPFSIFPMFSRSGRPWRNALVVALDDSDAELVGRTWTLAELPGPIVALEPLGIPQRDFAKLLVEERSWTDQGAQHLRDVLTPALRSHARLLVVDVRGDLDARSELRITARPFAELRADGAVELLTRVNTP